MVAAVLEAKVFEDASKYLTAQLLKLSDFEKEFRPKLEEYLKERSTGIIKPFIFKDKSFSVQDMGKYLIVLCYKKAEILEGVSGTPKLWDDINIINSIRVLLEIMQVLEIEHDEIPGNLKSLLEK